MCGAWCIAMSWAHILAVDHDTLLAFLSQIGPFSALVYLILSSVPPKKVPVLLQVSANSPRRNFFWNRRLKKIPIFRAGSNCVSLLLCAVSTVLFFISLLSIVMNTRFVATAPTMAAGQVPLRPHLYVGNLDYRVVRTVHITRHVFSP